MDAGQLTQLFALLAVAVGLGRLVMSSAGRAGDGLATLFVPPGRTLGWPHGVQESDEPWGWHSAPPAAADLPIDPAGDADGGEPTDEGRWIEPNRGALIVPVGRVTPVRFGVRPH